MKRKTVSCPHFHRCCLVCLALKQWHVLPGVLQHDKRQVHTWKDGEVACLLEIYPLDIYRQGINLALLAHSLWLRWLKKNSKFKSWKLFRLKSSRKSQKKTPNVSKIALKLKMRQRYDRDFTTIVIKVLSIALSAIKTLTLLND